MLVLFIISQIRYVVKELCLYKSRYKKRHRESVFLVFMVDQLGLDSRADYALGQSRL